MVLGNTFHLMLSPGAERIEALGGLHRFMGWERAIITDSGGFQVFSLAHGGVADEVKGRRGQKPGEPAGHGAVLEIAEEGVRFRSHIDGSEWFMGPEESMAGAGRARLRHRPRLRRVHPLPRRPRLHRPLDRAHPPLARPLPRLARASTAPPRQAVFGIVQGGVYEDLRQRSAERVAAADVDGIAIGGTLGRDKPEMYGVLDLTLPHLPADAPKHLLGIGEPDDLLEGIARGIDSFDCAVPTRLGPPRHGARPAPRRPLPFQRPQCRPRPRRGPARRGLPLRDLPLAHPRLRPLPLPRRGADRRPPAHPPQPRLHQGDRRGARAAIAAQRFGAYRTALLSGAAPWEAA